MNEYPEGVIVADVLDGCGDNLQVTYSDNWKRIINGDLAGGKKLQLRQVSRSAHQIAAIQPRMLLEGNAQLRQRLLCLLCIG